MMEAKELVSKMTLEEKASLSSGKDFWHLKAIERLGLQSIMIADGPHGLRKQAEGSDHLGLNNSLASTCFPTASATACSFDRDLLSRMGKAIAQECIDQGVSVILGPGINIKRSPLCGRNFEYFSEDPYLTGEMACAFIQGVQSMGVGTSLKHFAVNNQETGRMTVDARVDERALREIYLSSFETAVKKAKPWSVMASYNKINGSYACSNSYLLTDILRTEWGFEGLVMSDWGAVDDRVESLRAGMDLEMPGTGSGSDQEVITAVINKNLSMKEVDLCAQRVVEFIHRGQEKQVMRTLNRKEHHDLAREIATKSAVLLQNREDILPIDPQSKIAVIGGMAKRPRYQGAGSSRINPSELDNAFEALQASGAKVSYEEGYCLDSDRVEMERIHAACALAKVCDLVIVFAGLPDEYESEGFDRSTLSLPESHNQLIEAVATVNPNIVVVLQLGSPVLMPWKDQVKGILLMYLAGQAGGSATAELLFGKVNPSGKLAETFPMTLEDNPSYHYFPGENKRVQYRESIFVGYRYYDTAEKVVAFPFGHGLSYTMFEYKNLRIQELGQYGYRVELDVSNVGKRDGAEVVQLYVRCLASSIFRPDKEIKGFEKVFLKAGETGKVVMFLDKRSFSYYNTSVKDWCVESGTYELLLGSSCKDLRVCDRIEIDGDHKETLLQQYEQVMTAYKKPSNPFQVSDEQFEILLGYDPNLVIVEEGYTKNSTLNDVKGTVIGRILFWVIKVALRRKLRTINNPTMKLLVERTTFSMPLRALKMAGNFSNHKLDGLIQLVNGELFRGIKSFYKGKE